MQVLRARFGFLPLLAGMLAACATTTRVESLQSGHAARAEDCPIAFFAKEKPTGSYEAIGRIESHIAQNLLFGGAAKLQDEGYRELQRKACGLGGDAVTIDDHVTSAAAEMTHLHIWATVLRRTGAK